MLAEKDILGKLLCAEPFLFAMEARMDKAGKRLARFVKYVVCYTPDDKLGQVFHFTPYDGKEEFESVLPGFLCKTGTLYGHVIMTVSERKFGRRSNLPIHCDAAKADPLVCPRPRSLWRKGSNFCTGIHKNKPIDHLPPVTEAQFPRVKPNWVIPHRIAARPTIDYNNALFI